MKKLAIVGSALFVFASMLISTSCNNQNETLSAASNGNDSTALSIRYIDLDSVTANYDLVKDFNEVTLRTQANLNSAVQAKQQEIQYKAGEIDRKLRNHGYISEQMAQEDYQKLQQQQQKAEAYINNLQMKAQQEQLDQQMAFLDSLNNFIADYVKTHPYDAILFKNAGVYMNPKLDITKEVVAGLNARYTKKETSKK